jgi:hypothetical protein
MRTAKAPHLISRNARLLTTRSKPNILAQFSAEKHWGGGEGCNKSALNENKSALKENKRTLKENKSTLKNNKSALKEIQKCFEK